MMPKIDSLPPNRFGTLYRSIVSNEKLNYAVLGILGLWGFYSGASKLLLKQSEPWPGGVTLGVLAIICAAQGLTRSPRVELMCSWRILVTFFGLYMGIDLLADLKDDIWFDVALSSAVVIGVAWIYSGLWRRTYADTWNLNDGQKPETREYSAPNQGPQADT